MIYSMTGFARQQSEGDWGIATWEIRSVNQRFLDLSFRLPENLRALEPLLRDYSRNLLHRGKIECSLRYQPSAKAVGGMTINHTIAQQLLSATGELAVRYHLSESMTSLDFLRWPGVLDSAEFDLELIEAPVLGLFEETLKQMEASRQREGSALSTFIEQRLQQIEASAAKITTLLPAVQQAQREKITRCLIDAQVEAEPNRLEQELVLIAQKGDVSEELDRLHAHVKEMNRLLKSSERAVGRRLDFLTQEMNREANTLASKVSDSEIVHSAVDLKVLIEQIKEQVQNIE